MQSWSESEAIQPSSPMLSAQLQRATSTSAGPCSLARISTSTRVPSLGASAIFCHWPKSLPLIVAPAVAYPQDGASPCAGQAVQQQSLAVIWRRESTSGKQGHGG